MTAWIVDQVGHLLNVPGNAVLTIAEDFESVALYEVGLHMKRPAWRCFSFACYLRGR